jgi:hypothetical protein
LPASTPSWTRPEPRCGVALEHRVRQDGAKALAPLTQTGLSRLRPLPTGR